MKHTRRSLYRRVLAAVVGSVSLAGPASGEDITVRPEFEGRYVSSATVLTRTGVIQVVLHHCTGERTALGTDELTGGDAFPVSAGGDLLAGVTVIAADGVRAVGFACPSGEDPAAVSASRPRSEGDPVEGALF
jgi:hypothetical protein